MKVTREEWLAARDRLDQSEFRGTTSQVNKAVEVLLGPCPPEPAPRFYVEVCAFDVGAGWVARNLTVEATDGGRLAIGLSSQRLFMDADTARKLADALDRCAMWLDQHGGESA